jgi:RsiW-degrading membrane proteinase PrsW (M82 family)
VSRGRGGRKRRGAGQGLTTLLILIVALLIVAATLSNPASALGALPALFWMRYARRKDAGRPEPVAALRRIALVGAAATVPVAVVEVLVGRIHPTDTTVFGAFFGAFVVAGLIEESAKALCLRYSVWNREEFDERLDAMVYAAWAGLGFALVENVLYLAGTESSGDYVAMFIARAFMSVPLHASAAAIMGYHAARRRFDDAGPGIAGGLAVAVALHGTFDFVLFRAAAVASDESGAAGLYALAALGVVAVAVVTVRRLGRAALAADDADPRLPSRVGAGPVHVAGLPAARPAGWPPPAAAPPSGGPWRGR